MSKEAVRPILTALEPVDALSITTLVDNVSDMLLVDQGPAKRAYGVGSSPTPMTPSSTLLEGRGPDALKAEHGFSALVSIRKDGQEHRLLFDTGVSPDGMIGNMQRLDLSPKEIEALVLSHGHFDHTAGLDGLLRALGPTNLPVTLHPDFWNRRRMVVPGREPREIPTTSKTALRGAGFEIIEERRPSFLFERSLLVTGEVDRTTAFERGMPMQEALKDDAWQPDPLTLDDQAIVVNVRGKGLVVLSGCGHAGVVNIVRYATKLTGEPRVYAVMGGFHLGGPAFEPIIPQTCAALSELRPEVIVPTHCTGWRAIHTLAAAMPAAFIQNSVGTRFELVSGNSSK
ncbi:MAG: MBL fold metallo-hydrolase [Dehalococcoidia bacterium]